MSLDPAPPFLSPRPVQINRRWVRGPPEHLSSASSRWPGFAAAALQRGIDIGRWWSEPDFPLTQTDRIASPGHRIIDSRQLLWRRHGEKPRGGAESIRVFVVIVVVVVERYRRDSDFASLSVALTRQQRVHGAGAGTRMHFPSASSGDGVPTLISALITSKHHRSPRATSPPSSAPNYRCPWPRASVHIISNPPQGEGGKA